MRTLVLSLATLAVAGCASLQPRGFPSEGTETAKAIGTAVLSNPQFETLAANFGGQVIEPGYEGWAGVLYVAGAKLRGFSGQVSLGGQGHGPQELTPESKAAIIEAFKDKPDLLDKVLAYLERTQPKPNPEPAPE